MNESVFRAADIHQQVSGESSSFFSGLGDAISKGIPLAIGSGAVSMYNTAISLGNAFGADAEKIDYGAKVADYDDDLAAYYKEHTQGVDLAGYLATSIIPGLGGMKALKMIQGGTVGLNAARETGLIKNSNNLFGIFRNAEAKFTERALDKIRLSVNDVHDAVDSNKLIAIAAGVGEQALQGAAFQTAVLLTMNQNPILSKQDEGYFASFVSNSHEILTAGLIQGTIGGFFSGLSITGKLRKTAYDVDISELPSRQSNVLGKSEILGSDPGSAITVDMKYWLERGVEFELKKKSGELTESMVQKYTRTLHNQEYDIRGRLTKQMTKEFNGHDDGDLAIGLWDSILQTENPPETASIILSAARQIRRATTDLQPDEVAPIPVFTKDGPLPKRKAENILKRNEALLAKGKEGTIAPDIFSPEFKLAADDPLVLEMREFISPGEAASAELNLVTNELTQFFMKGDITAAQIKEAVSFTKNTKERVDNIKKLIQQAKLRLVPGEEGTTGFTSAQTGPRPFARQTIDDRVLQHWRKQGYEMYRDAQGDLHAIEDNTYVKGLISKGYKNVNPTVIVKFVGDGKGTISTEVYPTIGDYGTPSISEKGIFEVNGNKWQGLSDKYDPVANEPIQSHARFVEMHLKKWEQIGAENELGGIIIEKGDLPLLEKVANMGKAAEDTLIIYDGTPLKAESISQILLEEKLLWREQMLEAGHDMRKIARALNTTEEFAESGVASQDGLNFILSKIEDHTKPSFAVIDYETSRLPDGFLVKGVESLMTRVKMGYDANHVVSSDILGNFYGQLMKTKGTLFNITSVERFNNFIATSSPDYGGWGAVAVQSGKVHYAATTEAQKRVLSALDGLAYQIEQNKEAQIEVNQVFNRIRSSKEQHYIWPPEAVETARTPGPVTAYNPRRGITFIQKSVRNEIREMEKAGEGDIDLLIRDAIAEGRAFKIKDLDVEDLLLASHRFNQERAGKWNRIFAAMGSGRSYDVDEFYLPPLNTRKYPFVAFVKEKMDVGAGTFKEAGVIVAPDQLTFQAKLNRMREVYGDRFDFHTPDDIKKWKEIEGSYYDSPFLGASMPDEALRKEGLLYDFQPRTDMEIINDMKLWHMTQEKNIITQAIELHYAQEFAALRAMGEDYRVLAENKFGPKDKRSGFGLNPYMRYIHQATNVNDFDRYNSIWGKLNSATEKVGGKMFATWDVMRDKAAAGETDWNTANQIASSYGFTPPYMKVIPDLVNPHIDNRSFQASIAKMNGAVSTLTLGLDFLNTLVNVVAFPVMATAEMKNILNHVVKGDAAKIGALVNLTHVTVPGTQHQLPTPMKLLFNAVQSIFSPEAKKLGQYFEDIRAITTPSKLYLDVVDASQIVPEAVLSPEQLKTHTERLFAKVQDLAEAGKTITGYNKGEWAVRYMAAHMMKQLTDAAGVAAADAPGYINNFVNRVHGNYLASQRPHLFQGPIGQAISLFQTYQFNIMQNMIRYVEQGDKTAGLMLLGMQNTIFGLQSNPGFYILNQAIGNANREHIDITSGVTSLVGKDIADWMLYGLGSNALQVSLYNRGDLTPRYVTVVPTKIEDVPAIAIPIKAISAFLDATGNIAQGGGVTRSLLDGIAHSGFNRPLAGLAQLAQGYRTTNDGNLLTAYNDINIWTVGAKLAGGEELNRAIAIDAYYRGMAYKAKDKKDISELGEAIKTKMYNGESPTAEETHDFMRKYNNIGGNPQNFNRFFTQNMKHANRSIVNDTLLHANNPTGRQLAILMGGDQMPDYMNAPPPAAVNE